MPVGGEFYFVKFLLRESLNGLFSSFCPWLSRFISVLAANLRALERIRAGPHCFFAFAIFLADQLAQTRAANEPEVGIKISELLKRASNARKLAQMGFMIASPFFTILQCSSWLNR